MPTFKWKPLPEVTERLTFSTDIARTLTNEMRTSGSLGRTEIDYALTLTTDQYADFEEVIRDNTDADWDVPMWHERTRRVDLSSGATVVTATAEADYRVGGKLMIWGGCDAYELATIDSISGDTITLTAGVSANYTRAAVMPVHTCFLSAPVSRQKSQRGLLRVGVTFQLRETVDLAASPWGTYDGYEILGCSGASVTRLSGFIRPTLNYIDSGVGLVETVRDRSLDDYGQEAEITNHTWNVKRFLHQVRGRAAPFWVKAWGGELVIAAALAADTDVQVTTDRPAVDFVGRHVIIDGLYREVTAATGTGTVTLTLDSALGQDVAAGAPASLLALVRSDSDVIETRFGLAANRTKFAVLSVEDNAFAAAPDPPGLEDIALLANFSTSMPYFEESQFAEPISLLNGQSISGNYARFGSLGLEMTGPSATRFGGQSFASNVDWTAPEGLTFEGFVEFNGFWSVGDGATLFELDSGTGRVFLRFLKTGDVRFRINETNYQGTPATSAATIGVWRFFEVRIARSGLSLKVYIDGSIVIDTTIASFPTATTGGVSLLNGLSTGVVTNQFPGGMDSVRFTNRLTLTEGTVPITRLRSDFAESRV